MPTTADRLLRDHVRYTSDGLPNEPVGHPAPVGDPASGTHNPSKKDIRDAINSVTGAADRAEIAADAALAFVDEQPPLVVVAAGQSNMRSVPDQTGGDYSSNPRLFAWNSQAAPMSGGTAFIPMSLSSNPFIGTVANNLAFQFCKELQVRTGRLVYLILVALGGHHIEAFMNSVDLSNNGWATTPGEADLFTFLTAQIDDALPLVPGSPTSVDYFIWHQGEANKEDQVEVYANKMRTMLKRFENIGFIERNKTDIVAGELLAGNTNGRYRERHLSALKRLQIGTRQDAFPRFKIARSRGLQPVTLADDLHFSGEDVTAMGKRYVDAAFADQMPEEMDPTLIDLSVDTGLGWATSSFAAQNNTTYERREPIYLEDTEFTIEDNAVLGWCYNAPSSTDLTLVGRKMFRVLREAQFLYEIEIRNDHPSATGNFRVGAFEYDDNLAYIGNIATATQTVASGTTSRFSLTVGSTAGSRSNDADFTSNAVWFAPRFQISPGGTGAGLRWNIRAMRWL